jgi:hypothetical protein
VAQCHPPWVPLRNAPKFMPARFPTVTGATNGAEGGWSRANGRTSGGGGGRLPHPGAGAAARVGARWPAAHGAASARHPTAVCRARAGHAGPHPPTAAPRIGGVWPGWPGWPRGRPVTHTACAPVAAVGDAVTRPYVRAWPPPAPPPGRPPGHARTPARTNAPNARTAATTRAWRPRRPDVRRARRTPGAPCAPRVPMATACGMVAPRRGTMATNRTAVTTRRRGAQ